MSSSVAVFFNIHMHRSREAFNELIGSWSGILISDDYTLYRSWPKERRQSCLAHHLRVLKKLREDPDRVIARGGERLYKEVIHLVQMKPDPLTRGEWQGWVMRMRRLLKDLVKRSDALGTLASRLNDTLSLSAPSCVSVVWIGRTTRANALFVPPSPGARHHLAVPPSRDSAG